MTEPTVVDNSTLKSIACSTRALMRYHHGFTSREEKATLEAGTAAHAALAAYLDPLGMGQGVAEFALDIFDNAYREWAEANVASGDRLSWANTRLILAQWFAKYPLDALPFTVKHVEIGFQFPLTPAGDIAVCGRMDGIVQMHADGALMVLEHKTTGNLSPWWLQKFYLDSQLSGYISGARAHLGGANVVGAVLNAIEFKKLPDSTRKCRDHGTSYAECGIQHAKFEMTSVTRTPAMLEEWRKSALHLAKRWRDLKAKYPKLEQIPQVRTQGTFIEGFCGFCEMKDWCAAGRPMELVDSMFIKDPWDALDHAVTGRTSTL